MLVLAGGGFTKPGESWSSPVEGEALAVAIGLEGAKDYILGMKDLVVNTNHKLLLRVFEKTLGEINNTRLLSLIERTLWYKFRMVHILSEDNSGPDFISRYINPSFHTPQL